MFKIILLNFIGYWATKINAKKTCSIIVSILFLFAAVGSSTYPHAILEQITQKKTKEVFIKSPLLKKNKDDVFLVLGGEAVDIKPIENDLINHGTKVLVNNKLENFIDNNDITYFIYVGQVNVNIDGSGTYHPFCNINEAPDYYYLLIDAKTFKLLYANKRTAINYNIIMEPFLEQTKTIDLSFAHYFLTYNSKTYNDIVALGDNQKTKDASIKFINSSDDSLYIKLKYSKKKDGWWKAREYFNDKYAVYLNLATSSLLMRDFANCNANTQKAEELEIEYTFREGVYSRKLKSTTIELQSTINDSIAARGYVNALNKKTMVINNEFRSGAPHKRFADKKLDASLHMAYFNAIISFFKEGPKNVSLDLANLIDSWFSPDYYARQRLLKKFRPDLNYLNADYVFSVSLKDWELDCPKDLKHDGQFENRFNLNASLKISDNKAGFLLGEQTISYKNKNMNYDRKNYTTSELFRYLFDDNSLVLFDFYTRAIK